MKYLLPALALTLLVSSPVFAAKQMISAGGAYSLALKRCRHSLAWGDNYYGQLGDGTGSFNRCLPQQSLINLFTSFPWTMFLPAIMNNMEP